MSGVVMGDAASVPMTQEEFTTMAGVTSATGTTLAAYRDMVAVWNDRMNLVGPSFNQDFWRRHALDSAQLFHVEHQALRWADVGAGAGFPGVVLAILLKTRGAGHVLLVESMAKRVEFLREVVSRFELPASIHHGRAETMGSPTKVDVVTARACAPLSILLGYTAGFFKGGARGCFLKGQGAGDEIVEARRAWTFDAELVPSLSDARGNLIRLKDLKRLA